MALIYNGENVTGVSRGVESVFIHTDGNHGYNPNYVFGDMFYDIFREQLDRVAADPTLEIEIVDTETENRIRKNSDSGSVLDTKSEK